MNPKVSWEDQQAFRAVMVAGSLSAAARALGTAQATVRNRIEALERGLDTTLFLRTRGGLVPTDTARALADVAETMATASAAFVRKASEAGEGPAGTVRISVSEVFGLEVLPTMLANLCDRHPRLSIEIQLSNREANLFGHEADIAIRHFPPTQEQLHVRDLGRNPFGLYASPGYLDRHGTPADLADLVRHRLIGPDQSAIDMRMVQLVDIGISRSSFAVRADSHSAHLAAARAGLGIGLIQSLVARDDPRLRPVLPGVAMPDLGYWIVMHASLRATPRVYAAFNHLADAIAAALARP